MRYFITLLILFSCLDGYSQKVAVRLNALPATDGAFGAGVSYGIGNKSTVELAGSLRPWKRSEMYVNRYWLIQPEYKYLPKVQRIFLGRVSQWSAIQRRREKTTFRHIR